MKILMIFFVVSSFYYTVHSQQIDFYKEDLTFQLSKKYFSVKGNYYFCNHTDKKIRRLLFYPFDTTNDKSTVDSIMVYDITGNAFEKILQKVPSGIFFEIKIRPNDTSIYHIEYNQRIVSDSVRYILQTTKYWHKPLETAEYKLVVEKPVTVQTLSYRPDSVYQIQGMKIYYWWKENFLPEEDMIIHFTAN